MISVGSRIGLARFWTFVQYCRILLVAMRRKLRIQVAFEPNRLGREHLRQAYELLVPSNRRTIRARNNGIDNTKDTQVESQLRERRNVS